MEHRIAIKKTLYPYILLTRLNKPWGILLLAWPTLIAILLSSTTPNPQVWIIFILGIIITRSLGCAINDYADQWLDGQVHRTHQRPLVSGLLFPYQALLTIMILSLLALSLLYFLPPQAIKPACLSAILMIIYPYTKRFLKAPQLFLGLVFSMGIPMAYITQNHPLDTTFITFFTLNLLWVIIYDTIYAMTDQKDDEQAGAYSLARTLSPHQSTFVQIGYICLAASWTLWGYTQAFSVYYFLFLIPIYKNLFTQYQLVKKSKYFQAFLLNTQVGTWLFIAVLSQYL